jgi:peptide/nickel transport system permease protein
VAVVASLRRSLRSAHRDPRKRLSQGGKFVMFDYLVKRLATIVPTLVFVSMLIFGLQQLLPGDPAVILAGEERDPNVVAYLHAKLHLDDALPVRYGYWVAGVVRGDLGESVRTQQPVLALIAQKLPVTIELAILAMTIALVIGIPSGIISAVGRGTAWDWGANAFALWGLSTPNFWLGILMILLFSVRLGWLPASGYVSPFENLRDNLAAMVMPAFVLGNAIAAVLMRHTRSAMLQVLQADYVRTARAKGLRERAVVVKHALRNALTPIITLGALEFGTLLSGAVLTEQVFTIPGFGKLIVDSVFNRDYAVVQGVVLVTATAYIALNLLADLAYFAVNPRLRQ